ncbi:hypothetical protein MIND_01258200 [Mycena indigotica]|uniref:glutathione transferase n=1 Tax=Mycena indigotica TaxID=2126181 RepID=A0A8H6S2Q7_9AGAR|nr:uncharacterized protein MIND_01258200 [Mycena indigotica]KAF7291150.1 hypothetical protein MIND_01258200 [Mycena indigotica]
MVIKLYFAPVLGPIGGACVAALVLNEKQVPFEAVPVNLHTYEHRSQPHLSRQPFGQVPVLDDNGFILYETRAICRYVAEKYPERGPRLLPGPDLQERSLFEQAASVEFANFFAVVSAIRMEVTIKPHIGMEVDQGSVALLLGQLEMLLDVYEGILSKRAYLLGNELTLVDLFHLIAISAMKLGAIRELMTPDNRPNVARWWAALTSRPAWVRLQEEGIKSKSSVTQPEMQ